MEKTNVLEVLGKANNALFNKDLKAMETTKNELAEAIKEYNTASIKEHYNSLYETFTEENPYAPMLGAIKDLFTMGIKSKLEKDKDTGTEAYKLEDNPIQISLIKFTEYGKNTKKIYGITPDAHFIYAIERLNLLLTYRVIKEVTKPEDLAQATKRLSETYSISKIEKQIKDEQTPLSKSALLKELQKIIDGIMFVDNGNGKNAYKVISHDVNYLLKTYTRRGKKSGSIVCPRLETMAMLIMDICHKVSIDDKYDVEYTKRKETNENSITIDTGDENDIINSIINENDNIENDEISE